MTDDRNRRHSRDRSRRVTDGESTSGSEVGKSERDSNGVHGDTRIGRKVIPRMEQLPSTRELGRIIPRFEQPSEFGESPIQQRGDTDPDEAEFASKLADKRERARESLQDAQYQDDLPDEGADFGIGGPEYDEEMPLTDHIEEMIKRVAVVIVIAGSVTLVTFPFADQIINWLWFSILPGGDVAQPRVYGPLEFLITQLKVASLAGLIVALPVVVYETYAFMRPGLYRHERRYYLAAIPTSLVLGLVGVTFAYFVVLPALFTYFLVYSQEAGEIAFALGQTFDLILILMAYLAIVFQIPLFIMLAIMMGLTTREWLADKRLYFWGAFLGIAFISSPDPTGMAPIIIALTMISLFEGTIGLLKWVGR